MRKLLHKHLSLKEGLDFEGLVPDAEDLVEALPDDHYDPHERASKRQRIEAIATQYLKGRAPIILSARLRGPFNAKWDNPWGQKSGRDTSSGARNPKRSRGSQGLSEEARVNRRGTRHQRKAELSTISHIQEKDPANYAEEEPPLIQDRKAAGIRKVRQAGEESSGYGGRTTATVNVGRDIKVQPAVSEFVNGNTKRPTSKNNGTNSQWLRRRSGRGREVDMDDSEELERSPSPSRRRTRSVEGNRDGELHILPLEAPGITRSSPGLRKANTLDDCWTSSASVSKDVSLPMKQRRPERNNARNLPVKGVAMEIRQHGQRVDSSSGYSKANASAQCAQNAPNGHSLQLTMSATSLNTTTKSLEEHAVCEDESRTAKDIIHPQDKSPLVECSEQTLESYSSVLELYEASPLIVEGLRSAKRLAQTAIPQAVSPEGPRHLPPSREDIRRSAERCATGVNTAKLPTVRSKRKRPSGLNNSKANDVDLSAPASSASFTYRRLSDRTTTTTKTAQKPNPRPVNFNPSSTIRDSTNISKTPTAEQDKCSTEKRSSINQKSSHRKQPRQSDIYDVPVSDDDTTGDESGREHTEREGTNRQSLFSTQAAMMLAQMEFQDGSIPSLGSETPRPLAHLHDDTPTSAGGNQGLGPAITPISDFAAQLDKRHPSPDSILRPMSTQELFAATSPYDFSATKSALSRRSNLRFSVLSHQEHTMRDDNESGKKNSTPSAERIPLKDRNSRMVFRGANGSEKGSQESPGHPPLHSEKKVELPRVSFEASLDGSLGFTDGFLPEVNMDSVTGEAR